MIKICHLSHKKLSGEVTTVSHCFLVSLVYLCLDSDTNHKCYMVFSLYPYHVTYPMMHVMYLPLPSPNRMKDITFPQLRWMGADNKCLIWFWRLKGNLHSFQTAQGRVFTSVFAVHELSGNAVADSEGRRAPMNPVFSHFLTVWPHWQRSKVLPRSIKKWFVLNFMVAFILHRDKNVMRYCSHLSMLVSVSVSTIVNDALRFWVKLAK